MRLSLAVYAVALANVVTSYPIAKRQSGLPACAFWGGNITVPDRPVTPFIAPDQQSPVLNLSKNTLGATRLPVPPGIAGILTSGSVNITLDRVTGAQGYRVWRDANAVAWISDWGQPSLSALDSAPCDGGFYTIAAMQDGNGNDTSMGVMSLPYQIQSNGQIGTYKTPVGKVLQVRVTSYNDLGSTATGYKAQLGGCAVDPRVIPWGTYFYVPDYGYCLAIDIGTWIQDNAVDIWLPDEQAGNWGVQYRNITIVGDMANPPTSAPPTSASASTTKTASSTTTSTTSTVSTPTTTVKSTTNTKSTTTKSTTTQPTKATTTTKASTTTTTSQTPTATSTACTATNNGQILCTASGSTAYTECVNGGWVSFQCAPGTVCQQSSSSSITCQFP